MTAAIDYNGIASALQSKLTGYAALSAVKVNIEEELALLGVQSCPWVGIYLERRDGPPELQGLSGGTRQRLYLRYSIWCWQASMDGSATAISLRNTLIGNVELALITDRDLNGLARTLWLEGGNLMSGQPEGGSDWMSGGEIIAVVDATAIA